MREQWFRSRSVGTVSILLAAVVGAGTGCGGSSPEPASVAGSALDLGGGTYQGCYTDYYPYALPAILMGSGATVESCIAAARAQGYRYAGLQWGGRCSGGSTLAYALVADSECNQPCTANPGETCGGSYRNSIWSTFIVNPGDDPPPGDVLQLRTTAGTSNVHLWWVNPGDPDFGGVLVVKSETGPVDFAPVNGIAYTVGSAAGTNGVVGSVGTAPNANLAGLAGGQRYDLKVFAFDAAHNYSAGIPVDVTTLVPTGTYQGCYTDYYPYALPAILMGSGATVESCIGAARAQGYRYAGLQWGGRCSGGSTLAYALVADSECNQPCTANPGETCGGSYRNSIWSTFIVNPGDDPPPGDVLQLRTTAGTSNVHLWWVNPGDPDFGGVLVVRSSDSQSVPVNFVPVNGATYTAGATVGTSGAVVGYVGTTASANLGGLASGQQYYLKIFAFDAAHNYSAGIPVDATTLVPTGTYQGCYTDYYPYALPAILMGSGATVESCIGAARAQGYRYAGLQWGGNCYAGNTLAYALVADSQCNQPCTANPGETCGGAYRNSIWSTDAPWVYAGPDQLFECPATPQVNVTLSGSSSYDPSATYLWSWTEGGALARTVTGPSPTITLPIWGTYDIGLQVTSLSGAVSTDAVRVVVGDTLAPRTTAFVVGRLGNDGVYTSNVDVTLTSRDSCTGVKEIHYTIDGVETVVPVSPVLPEASTTFTVSSSGTHMITYWAVDDAGRSSDTVQIPPIDVNPPPGGGSCTSSCSVVIQPPPGEPLFCTLNGLQYQPVVGSVSVTQEGANTLICGYAAPMGNIEPVQTLWITIDTTGPTITILGVENGASYVLGFVPTASHSVSDPVTGVASASASTSGGDGYGLGVFTYAVTATDGAGNTSMASATYTVIATIPGLRQLVTQYRDSGAIDPSIVDTLLSYLASAEASPAQQDDYLQEFSNMVRAQSGKKIEVQAAGVLMNAAAYVIAHN